MVFRGGLTLIEQKSGTVQPCFTSTRVEEAEQSGRLDEEEVDIIYTAGGIYAGMLYCPLLVSRLTGTINALGATDTVCALVTHVS